MHITPSILCGALALISASVSAQTDFVSPPVFKYTEGSSSSGITFTNPTTRTQQCDSNLIGGPLTTIRSLAFRRTNIHSNVAAFARTADVTILMGHGDLNNLSSTFATNFLGAPTTVFTKKPVNLPDWTSQTMNAHPFDLKFVFDVPFPYNRTDPVVWDVSVENNTGGGSYYMDWTGTPPAITSGSHQKSLGTGCTTANGSMTIEPVYTASAANLDLAWGVTAAPSSAQVFVAVDLRDNNIPLPGLCTNLHPMLAINAPVGTADVTGTLPVTSLVNIPWTVNFADVSLVTQVFSLDPTQAGLPAAFSNGSVGTSPNVVGSTPFLIDSRVYSNTSIGPTGSGPFTSAAPVMYSGS